MPTSFASALRDAVDAGYVRLQKLTDSDACLTSREGGWTRKQELGHLIDSSINNHVRFIVATLQGEYTGPTYAQNGWVDLNGYASMPWKDIVDQWYSNNLMLARVVSRIPADRLPASCRIGDGEPVTLRFLIEDYIDHMQGHLLTILPKANATHQ